MKYQYSALAILLLIACNTPTKVKINNTSHEAYRPPNCIQIADNLFADETELANIDYKEYIQWSLKVYGKASRKYLSTLPDSNVWTTLSYGEPLKTHYYRHPAYDNYPVIGITLEQAKDYTEWRTERVAEMYLKHKGLIKPINHQDTLSNFTIDRYINGNYDWIIKKESFLLAKYKIPTINEWEQMAGIDSKLKYGVDSLSRHNKKISKTCALLFNTDIGTKTPKCHPSDGLPCGVREYSKNVHKLYNTIGNVAEMVDAPNTSKGGSWKHPISDIEITKNDTFTTPNSWTGFRNVCQLELVKIP